MEDDVCVIAYIESLLQRVETSFLKSFETKMFLIFYPHTPNVAFRAKDILELCTNAFLGAPSPWPLQHILLSIKASFFFRWGIQSQKHLHVTNSSGSFDFILLNAEGIFDTFVHSFSLKYFLLLVSGTPFILIFLLAHWLLLCLFFNSLWPLNGAHQVLLVDPIFYFNSPSLGTIIHSHVFKC